MAWSAPMTFGATETINATVMNREIRDNILETAVAKVTTAGDTVYATAANALARLAIGAANTVMTSSGSAPQWSTSLSLAGTLAVNGNATIGDASGDAHTVNGQITLTHLPRCMVYNNSAVTTPSSPVTFDSDAYDPLAMHDTGSNTSRITVPATGDYEVEFVCVYNHATASPALAAVVFSFLVNGSDASPKLISRPVGNSATGGSPVALRQILSLTASDYVEVAASGVVAGDAWSAKSASFSVKRVA